MQVNRYSPTWFELFLHGFDARQTENEIAFLRQFLPISTHWRILDMCCGAGRHAGPLAQAGYCVTGVDVDSLVLAEAANRFPSARFLNADMRDLPVADGAFDGVICLWQSFGYFDSATNFAILQRIRRMLIPGGRLIVDLYHRGFFVRNLQARNLVKSGRIIRESKSMETDRLRVRLDYDDGKCDAFDWQVFEPEELCRLGSEVGFETILVCSGFDPDIAASAEMPRIQIVFEVRE